MKIQQWQQCHELSKGQLVVDADFEVWRVSKHDDETWLEPFSDEYATIVRSDGGVRVDSETAKLPLTVVKAVPVDESQEALDKYIAAIVSGDWARLSQLRDELLRRDEEAHS